MSVPVNRKGLGTDALNLELDCHRPGPLERYGASDGLTLLPWYLHLLRDPGDLDTEAAAVVARVLQDTEAAKIVDLGRRFCRIVRSRCSPPPLGKSDVTVFDERLCEAQTCGIRIVENFAASLGQDGDAVRAALALPWSSEQAEGQITRLKLLKRVMYGRANLDLLRRRLLLAA